MARHYRILTPNDLELSFPGPQTTVQGYVKFDSHIATTGAMTDRQTDASDLIICSL